MQAAARFVVRGVVQGVFFRASTRAQAQRLQLHGHAINLPDGSVEVVASGRTEDVGELERWLRHGPVNAKVETVEREAIDPGAVGAGFSVG